ncbi:hypothetical protein WMF37_41910 [Sorangium sp. So ce291]|uniref:hypothetical protein n=1 Tax=Sorangium sp. So ce291 TaxID=3133294 RepID=UPI003F645E72
MRVNEIMTFPAITIAPTDSVAHAEETMNREKIEWLNREATLMIGEADSSAPPAPELAGDPQPCLTSWTGRR